MSYLSLKIGEEELTAPSGVPKELQGGLDTAGQNIFQTGINLVFLIAATLAIIIIMYSGIQWITSGGDADKIAHAKVRMKFALLGLIIAALAFFGVRVIVTIFGGDPQGFLNPSTLLK